MRQILRWNPERSYPTDQDMEEFQVSMEKDLRRVNPSMPDSRVNTFIQEVLARYELAPDEPLPLFITLEGDGDGGVWIGDYAINRGLDGLPRYDVVSSKGEWMGTVECPPRFRVLDIAFGKVLGVLSGLFHKYNDV
ncbi:MAG: hypothetical protein ABIF09_09965 [Gemmatimonadota bacterium]